MLEKKTTVPKLLELTRKAYQRHIMISEHLATHFDVNYSVFTNDPLFDEACNLLDEIIKDHQLLLWWLNHDEDDCFYCEPGQLGGVELITAQMLWNYYQAKQKKEG